MQNIITLAEEFSTGIWKRNDRIELTEVLEQFIADKGFSLDTPEVIDTFDRLKKLVVQRLSRKISEAQSGGVRPRYTFAEFDSDYLLPLTNVAEDEIRGEVTVAVSSLSWRAFERVCAAVLTVHGVQAVTARGSKEEGIDIFGLVKLRELSSLEFWHDATVRMAGQSKKGKITEPMVRLFARDLESVRRSRGRGYAQSPPWFQHSLAPVFGMMFTASTVARTAKAWGDSNGIMIRDGRQIVESMLHSKEKVRGFSYHQSQLVFEKDYFIEHFEQLDS